MEAKSEVSVKLYRVAKGTEETIGPDKRNAGEKYLLLELKPRKRTLVAGKTQEVHKQPIFDKEYLDAYFDEYLPLVKSETALTPKQQQMYEEFSGVFYDIPGRIVSVENLPPFQLQLRDDAGNLNGKWGKTKTSLQVFMLFDVMEDGSYAMHGTPLEEARAIIERLGRPAVETSADDDDELDSATKTEDEPVVEEKVVGRQG